MDDVSGREFRRPWAIGAGGSHDGQTVRAGNPVRINHTGEQIATSTSRHRDTAECAEPERLRDVLRPEYDRHIARRRDGRDTPRLQREIANIGTSRPAEKHLVGCSVPARAVDEALAIRREAR